MFGPLRFSYITRRMKGPGGLYNIGNVLALASGLAFQLFSVPAGTGFGEAARGYLFGNPAASWLTLAILTFIVAGEAYHRAYDGGSGTGPIVWLTRMGDGISALAAVFLSLSLASSGSLFLAAVAGLLLAGGKLGSAILPSLGLDPHKAFRVDRVFRWVVIASRIPSLLTLGLQLMALQGQGTFWPDGFLPGAMVVCFLLWIAADLALTRQSNPQPLRPTRRTVVRLGQELP